MNKPDQLKSIFKTYYNKIKAFLSEIDNYLLEFSFLLLGALVITFLARLLLFIESSEAYQQLHQMIGENGEIIKVTLPLYFYAVWQDLLSLVFILFFAYCFGLFFPYHPRCRFGMWGGYYFCIGLVYLLNVRYFRIYGEPFHWYHIKSNAIDSALWSSIWAEVDTILIIEFIFLIVLCSIWLYLTFSFVSSQVNDVKRKKVKELKTFPKKKSLIFNKALTKSPIFFYLCIIVCILPFFSYVKESQKQLDISFSHKKDGIQKNHMNISMQLEQKKKVANFLLYLAFFQEKKVPATHGMLTDTIVHRKKPFSFGFDSSSLLKQEKQIRNYIPFPKRGKKYNIVLYLFESTAYTYLQKKILNQPVTPTWNKLEKNAIVFQNHYVQSPLSINSLFSILTSAYSMPADIWVAQKYPHIPLQSLSETLKKHGYQTAFLHTGSLSYAGQNKFLKNRSFHLIQDKQQLRLSSSPYTKEINWGLDDRVLVSAARDFVTKVGEAPYFLILSPLSPHHPYDIPEEKFAMSKEAVELDTKINKKIESQIVSNPPIRKKLKGSFQKYLNSLHYADLVLKEIIETLTNLPRGKDTLFFVLADHGEAFGQHRGNFNHPFYLYEENVHVPFLIYNEYIFPKSIHYSAVSRHIDVLPTILDILGIPKEKTHEGVSLISRGSHQVAFFYTSWRNQLLGIRDGPWKYIFNLYFGTEELYNLHKDSLERKNLWKEHPDIVRGYREYLQKIMSYQRKYFETVLGEKIKWRENIDKSNY